MNSRKYAKLLGGNPQYAPYTMMIGRVSFVTDSLTEAQANAIGYKVVVDIAPETDEDHYAQPTGWEDGDRITRTYQIVERPKYARQWTPLSIKRACSEKWAKVKVALQNADIYEEFLMAQYLAEDDESFKVGYEWACQEFGKEAVDAILDAAAVSY